MVSVHKLEFINRADELLFLDRCLTAAAPLPALIFLRAPSGVGKSSLTDHFRTLRETPELPFCILDPSILDSPAAPSLYQGLFLQRCAAALDQEAVNGAAWPSFAEFLRSRRWRTTREKPKHELIEELPSPESLYKQASDYVARFFSLGRFDPAFLLESDQSHAVALCVAYVEHTLDVSPTMLIIREAQLIDVFSLKMLLGWQLTGTPVNLLFEYMTDAGFLPAHEKAILRAAEMRGSFSVYDIKKLSLLHLQQLIHTNVRSDFLLETEAHLSWNGNLRSVLELKFRVGIGQPLALPIDVKGVLGNPERSISDHVAGLTPQLRIVLAFLHANAEPLAQPILQQVLTQVDRAFRPAQLPRLIDILIEVHGFVQRIDGALRLHNETVAQSIAANPIMRPLIALAEKALREHYRTLITRGDFAALGLPAAVRQVFRLCVTTKDVSGLVAACSDLADQVRTAQDQTFYVDAVSSALDADPDLYRGSYEVLRIWAASLAYDTADWERAAGLLEGGETSTAFGDAMRACALQEIGRHEEALAVAIKLKKRAVTKDERIAGRLIEILVRGCRGDTDFARMELLDIVGDPSVQASPLVGYAYRLFEVVEGMTASLPRLQASIAWFERFGLSKARAYSELPTAILLARFGRTDEAREMIVHARSVLDGEVRDQHIILNNAAAVELLTEGADAQQCVEQLRTALRFARDDFSELAIITNLALAHLTDHNVDQAVECALGSLRILEQHDFAYQQVFWAICFNAIQVFRAASQPDNIRKAQQLLEQNKTTSASQAYWDYRFGLSGEIPSEYTYLATRPIHPIYLSHWTIELEGLEILIQESQRLHPHKSSPSP